MRQLLLILIILCFASIAGIAQGANVGDNFYPTREDLVKSAVSKGIIPPDFDAEYFLKKIQEKNVRIAWLGLSYEYKKEILGKTIEMFKFNGVVIKKPVEYYVKEINKVFYNAIMSGDFENLPKFGVIFKTLAILDGDFDNGQDSKALFRAWVPAQSVEVFKKNYPEKYKNIFGDE